MILRIWRTGIAPGKGADFERFANTISLPMFRSQEGCLSVLFCRTDQDSAVITIWDSHESIERMERSTLYQSTVKRIEESGTLAGSHGLEVFDLFGGFINHESMTLAP